MQRTNISRRALIGGVAVGISGFVSTTTAVAQGPPENQPNIEFPDGDAFVGPDNPGPMGGAVETENVHMPEGGWVLVHGDIDAENDADFDDVVIGRSMQKLPAGHFRKLRVAVKALPEGTYDLRATLFKELGDPPELYSGGVPYSDGVPSDSASISFP